jgi:antitoxin (DNA-binding transcriptional repressor) of toxin-antitoxin stability system
MQTINIHEAKTHLSRLVEDAALGKVFIIAKAGKPMVKVSPLAVDENQKILKLGFMSGEIMVPDDFDTIGSGVLSDLFEGRLS